MHMRLDASDERPITRRDLIQYVAGTGDREMRERIDLEAKITGSRVQKWLAQMDAKLADPFSIDWGRLALLGGLKSSRVEPPPSETTAQQSMPGKTKGDLGSHDSGRHEKEET